MTLSTQFMFIIITAGFLSSRAQNAPRDVTGTPYSRHSILLEWKAPFDSEVTSYLIEYGFQSDEDAYEVATNNRALNYTMTELGHHYEYRFRVAAKNLDSTGAYSPWVSVRLDVQSFTVMAELPSETKSAFQESLYEVLPLSYLSSVEINSTSIALSSIVMVYYEISFTFGVNFTREQVTLMFERPQARARTSFVRNIKVYDLRFCSTGLSTCHRHATCIDIYGSFRCECLSAYIDVGVKNHLFPGMNCQYNTGEPVDLTLSVINPITVNIYFAAPENNIGQLNGFEVEWTTKSILPSPIEAIDIESQRVVEYLIENLRPNSLYKFRARALTSIAEGKWSPWKQVRTVSQTYKLIFDMNLNETISDYQVIQAQVEANITVAVESALNTSSTISMTDFKVIRSDLTGEGLVRFQGYMYTKRRGNVDLAQLSRISNAKLKRKQLPSNLGQYVIDSATIEDVNECGMQMEDCMGNLCINQPGTFACQCPHGNIDVSDDYHMLPGRQCMVFDAPPEFLLSLKNPRSVRLSWRIPAQMRLRQLTFWFIVEFRLKGNSTVGEVEASFDGQDFTGENFVMTTTVSDLQMNSDYEFRVAATNPDKIGRFTSWKPIKTSNVIFTAKLNLTLIVYSPNLQNENYAITAETANNVRNMINRILLQRMPHYMATGGILFTPGILDRTFAYAHMFFKPNANVQAKHVEDLFKHNSYHDDVLGLDFDAVKVTDFDECDSTWDDCSANARCFNEVPGYRCECAEEYVDLSESRSQLPGRYCLHRDLITTPQPATTPSTVEVTTAPLRTTPMSLPVVVITGEAVSPNIIRLTWRRPASAAIERSPDELNYMFQYRIKGLVQWEETSVSASITRLYISPLRYNLVYEIRVAERWKDRAEAHTLFSFPIEVRTNPRSFRILLRLTGISESALSTEYSSERERLGETVLNFIDDVFSHPDVTNNYRNLQFGSASDVTFFSHPEGVGASAIIYLLPMSKATPAVMTSAYHSGEGKSGKQFPIFLIAINDLDECSYSPLNDCYTSHLCTNTEGSYKCTCPAGYVDSGVPYSILPGRYCIQPDAPSTVATTTTQHSILDNLAPLSLDHPALATTTTTTTTRRTTPTQHTTTRHVPVNNIGLTSPNCPRGQRKIDSNCQNVLAFLGSVNVLKQSGTDVTETNLLGDGKKYLNSFVQEALDFAFNDIGNLNDFLMTEVQNISVTTQGIIRSMFVIILDSPSGIRFRRQLWFSPTKVSNETIRQEFVKYLKELTPTGEVRPTNGATVTFDPDSVVVSDIDECHPSRPLYDCDERRAECHNTVGGFTCECNRRTIDVSPNLSELPGRRCVDQCNVNPCANGGICMPQNEVGDPKCSCVSGFSGSTCQIAETTESGPNLTVIALASVGGVVFIFLVCFGITFFVHRRNKRREKMMKKRKPEEIGDDHYTYDNSDFTDSDDDYPDQSEILPRTESAYGNHDALSRNSFPPPLPPAPVRSSSQASNRPPVSLPRQTSPVPPIPTRSSLVTSGRPPVVTPSTIPHPIQRTNPSSAPRALRSSSSHNKAAAKDKKSTKSVGKDILEKKKKVSKAVGGRIRKHSIDDT